jgi:hypothetical protein
MQMARRKIPLVIIGKLKTPPCIAGKERPVPIAKKMPGWMSLHSFNDFFP